MEKKVNKDCRYISSDNHCNIMAQQVKNCKGCFAYRTKEEKING